MDQYFVYMLTNRWHNVVYVGVTNSLERRTWEHQNAAVPGFTKKYNCDQLVYYEIFGDVKQAIGREKQIKAWSRAKKDALVKTLNPSLSDLAADWYDSGSDQGIPRRLRGSE